MNFYICDIHHVAQFQQRYNITKTLSLVNDYHKKEYMWPEYKGEHTVIHVRDHEWYQNKHSPTKETVEKILAFRETIEPEDNVLVHCIGGVSRSPAAMLIILHRWYKPEECIKMLEKIRPLPFPNIMILSIYGVDEFFYYARDKYDLSM